MECSDRISECREVVRTRLLRDSTHSGGSGSIFAVLVRAQLLDWTWGAMSTCSSEVDHHEQHILQVLARWFLSSCCRLREPAGNCLRSSQGMHRILVRRTPTTHSVTGPHCCMGRETQRSRGKRCIVFSRLRGRRTSRFTSPGGEGTGCEKKAAKLSAPSGIAIPPPKGQCQSELQATMLAHALATLSHHEVQMVSCTVCRKVKEPKGKGSFNDICYNCGKPGHSAKFC